VGNHRYNIRFATTPTASRSPLKGGTGLVPPFQGGAERSEAGGCGRFAILPIHAVGIAAPCLQKVGHSLPVLPGNGVVFLVRKNSFVKNCVVFLLEFGEKSHIRLFSP